MKKTLTIITVFLGLFLVVGITQAAEANLLQPASTITYNEDLTVNGTGRFNSVYIGRQGVGGVTFFNGTIVNIGEYIPVTFGDDVRIDGQIWGGPNKGNAEDQGLKVADTLLPGLTDINDIGSSDLKWRDIYLSGNISGNEAGLNNLIINNSINIPDSSLSPGKIEGTAWTGNNDGSGSGLAADLLDGKQAADFSLQSHNHDSEYLSINGGQINGNLNVTGSFQAQAISANSLNAGGVTTGSVTSNGYFWSSSRTDYTSVTGRSCVGSNVKYDQEYCAGDGTVSVNAKSLWNVNFPNDVTITAFRAKIHDNTNSIGLTCTLKRLQTYGNVQVPQDIVSVGTSNPEQSSSPFIEDNTAINSMYEDVDNSEYNYFIECNQTNASSASNSLGAYGFRVTYDKSEAD